VNKIFFIDVSFRLEQNQYGTRYTINDYSGGEKAQTGKSQTSAKRISEEKSQARVSGLMGMNECSESSLLLKIAR